MCAVCFEESNGITFCDCCSTTLCLSCVVDISGQNLELCKGCAAEELATVRCGCGFQAYMSDLLGCSRCHGLESEDSFTWYGRPTPTRKITQCCACHVVCCFNCDPNPEDGGLTAGVAAREAWPGPFMHPRLAEYADCTFCCSRPEACSGLADFLKLAEELEGKANSGDEADGMGDFALRERRLRRRRL